MVGVPMRLVPQRLFYFHRYHVFLFDADDSLQSRKANPNGAKVLAIAFSIQE